MPGLMTGGHTINQNGTKLVRVEVLWPNQPIRVMLSQVSLPNHTFPGQAQVLSIRVDVNPFLPSVP